MRALFCRRMSTGRLREAYTGLVKSGRLRADASQATALKTLAGWNTGKQGVTRGFYLHGPVGCGKSMLMDMFYDCTDHQPRLRLHFHELMLQVHSRLHKLHAARPKRIVTTLHGLPVYKYDAPASPILAQSEADESIPGEAARQAAGQTAGEAAKEVSMEPHPLEQVAEQLLPPNALLCLDEMQVTDVADALILRRLFECFLARGVRIVFTSNRPPEELYERGLNRRYFEPFVQLVRETFVVMPLGDGGIDYRRDAPRHDTDDPARFDGTVVLSLLHHRPRGQYFHGAGAHAALSSAWDTRVGASSRAGHPTGSKLIDVGFGRKVELQRAEGDACWFDFEALCGRYGGGSALGGPDFLAIAAHCRTLFIQGVPVLGPRQRNEARRFVILVDALYEARVQLFLSADEEPSEIFSALLGTDAGAMLSGAEVDVDKEALQPSFEEAPVGGRFRADGELATFFTAKDESFMLRRTLSRLAEMCTQSCVPEP